MGWALIKEGEWTSSIQNYNNESEAYNAYKKAKEKDNDWLTIYFAEIKESVRYIDKDKLI